MLGIPGWFSFRFLMLHVTDLLKYCGVNGMIRMGQDAVQHSHDDAIVLQSCANELGEGKVCVTGAVALKTARQLAHQFTAYNDGSYMSMAHHVTPAPI